MVIVSLTSYPKRIDSVHKTIKSLIDQTVHPDKIILWLSEDEFISNKKEVGNKLLMLVGKNGFEIRWVKDNLKPHKKYYYALQEYCKDIVITVDDDVIYSESMVESLLNAHMMHPSSVLARRVRCISKIKQEISSYIEWENNIVKFDEERLDLLPIGVGGVLYPPFCANDRWFDVQKINSMALNQDDLWLKYNEIIDGISCVLVKDNADEYIEMPQENTLFNTNVIMNDIVISNLFSHMSKQYEKQWNKFENNLVQLNELRNEKCERIIEHIKNEFLKFNTEKIYIYGAGERANQLYNFLKLISLDEFINGFLVTDVQSRTMLQGKRITLVEYIDIDVSFTCICGVSEKYKEQVKNNIKHFRNCNWYEPDYNEIKYVLKNEVVF